MHPLLSTDTQFILTYIFFFKYLFIFRLSCLNITLSKGIKTSNISHHVAAAKTTVDAADVERHSKQAKDWWDENGLIKALHSYNLIR